MDFTPRIFTAYDTMLGWRRPISTGTDFFRRENTGQAVLATDLLPEYLAAHPDIDTAHIADIGVGRGARSAISMAAALAIHNVSADVTGYAVNPRVLRIAEGPQPYTQEALETGVARWQLPDGTAELFEDAGHHHILPGPALRRLLNYEVADLRDTALPEGTYDAATIYNTLQHWDPDDQTAIISNIAHGLRPDGIFSANDILDPSVLEDTPLIPLPDITDYRGVHVFYRKD